MLETLSEITRHRALVWSLVQRQLAVRYRGSVLGFVWTFLNPLCVMLVYTLVFSVFVRDPSIEHYGTFVFCGLLPWIWFSSALLEGANAIVGGGTLITKALFPAQILPTVTALSHAVNFLLSLPMLLPFLIASDRPFGWALLALPVVMTVQFALIFAIVLGVAALNVHYRDVQHILGNVLSLWFFVTPIIFSIDSLKNRHWLLQVLIAKVNPMGVLTQSYQSILYWGQFPNWRNLMIVFLGSIVVFVVSHSIFRSYRDGFAEEI